MDTETQKVLTAQEKLKGLIEHEGWGLARTKLTERILELQQTPRYADLVEKNDTEGLMIAVKADITATEILFDWLQTVEGEALASAETRQVVDKSYIVKL